jgi:hypothetical protein
VLQGSLHEHMTPPRKSFVCLVRIAVHDSALALVGKLSALFMYVSVQVPAPVEYKPTHATYELRRKLICYVPSH